MYEISRCILDPSQNFSHHEAYIKSKLLGMIGLLGQIRSFAASLLYKTPILPIVNYCDYVYDCLSVKDSEKFQKLQNCSIHHYLECNYLTPTDKLQEELGFEFLDIRRQRLTDNEMYQIVPGLPSIISTGKV